VISIVLEKSLLKSTSQMGPVYLLSILLLTVEIPLVPLPRPLLLLEPLGT
jgi:hypothetical protein